MTWFKVDDSFHTHPKVLSIPRGAARLRAMGLWTSLGTWCAQHLTDGHVPKNMVDEHGGTRRDAVALVESGLWIEVENGYQFASWSDWQPTKSDVYAERAEARERMARARASKKAPPAERKTAPDSADVQANTDRTSESVRLTPTRPDPSYAAAAASTPLPPPVEILRSRATAAKLDVRWDRLTPAQLDEIEALIDVHGDAVLVRTALQSHRPDAPAAFAQAWLGQWRQLTPPGTALHAVPDVNCSEPGHQGTTRHCVQCASENIAARKDA